MPAAGCLVVTATPSSLQLCTELSQKHRSLRASLSEALRYLPWLECLSHSLMSTAPVLPWFEVSLGRAGGLHCVCVVLVSLFLPLREWKHEESVPLEKSTSACYRHSSSFFFLEGQCSHFLNFFHLLFYLKIEFLFCTFSSQSMDFQYS